MTDARFAPHRHIQASRGTTLQAKSWLTEKAASTMAAINKLNG